MNNKRIDQLEEKMSNDNPFTSGRWTLITTIYDPAANHNSYFCMTGMLWMHSSRVAYSTLVPFEHDPSESIPVSYTQTLVNPLLFH